MALIYFDPYILYRVGCLFMVSKNVSEFYFLGVCISNRMDLKGGVNCTNLLNVFLGIVNPLYFGEFSPS